MGVVRDEAGKVSWRQMVKNLVSQVQEFQLDSGCQWFSKCVGLAAAVSPGKLLEMQILGSHPRPTEPEILGLGLSHLCFNKPSREF